MPTQQKGQTLSTRASSGISRCVGKGCDYEAAASVLVHIVTFGGRVHRRKATSGAVRLCERCIQRLAQGHIPATLRTGIELALDKVREVA